MGAMSDIARKAPAGLKPLDSGLGAEVLDWVGELRMIWAAIGLSMNEFASLQPIDKGTISRYLNGQRVPRDHWFLDKLLAIQADNGKPVTPAVREHLTRSHLRALQIAHPHEYRVRLISDELEIALTCKLEAERYARALEEQLAERNHQVQELTDDKSRLRAAWDADRVAVQADYERLIREIDEITGQLHLARERAIQAERRCQQLEDLLDQLDAYPADEDSTRALLSTVSHELRAPLTSVKGFTATLLNKWDRFTDDQKRVMLEVVNADADRVTRLIAELMDVSRIESGQVEIYRRLVDLPDQARKIIAGRVAAGDHQDRFRLEVRAGLPETWLDADRIDQILGELVANAVRHGAGVVTIVVEPTYLDGDEAASRRPATSACLTRPPFPCATRATAFHPKWRPGCSSRSGAASGAAAPGSACTSSRGWSKHTAARSACRAPAAAAPSSGLLCRRGLPRQRAPPPSAPREGTAPMRDCTTSVAAGGAITVIIIPSAEVRPALVLPHFRPQLRPRNTPAPATTDRPPVSRGPDASGQEARTRHRQTAVDVRKIPGRRDRHISCAGPMSTLRCTQPRRRRRHDDRRRDPSV